MEENRAPVPATSFLIQGSLGTMLCRAPTQVQQEPVQSFPREMKPCQGQGRARDEHVQSQEKHTVLAGASLERMEQHSHRWTWGRKAPAHQGSKEK